MSATNNKIKSGAAESLVACLFEMAEANSNPVLQVINPDIPLEENKKYPPDLLQFSDSGWRAYYHCHPASRAGNHRFTGEHGHFHLFVQIKKEPAQWSHLAALAMDNMGQPLGWFTVNHWVTGECWGSTDVLIDKLDNIPFLDFYKKEDRVTNYELVERWLLSFLALSIEKVKIILQQRDENLKKKQSEHGESDVKTDKDIYLLSEIPVNISTLLNIYEGG